MTCAQEIELEQGLVPTVLELAIPTTAFLKVALFLCHDAIFQGLLLLPCADLGRTEL